ncbi:MAG: hypothetical protein AUI36_34675, partial [Cyanobacteria bacterium 13_1_40CM_2_61_4]
SLLLQPALGTVFRGQFGGRPYSLTDRRQNQWLQNWAGADEGSLTRGLVGFLEEGVGAEVRFGTFARAAEEAELAGKIEPDAGAVLAFGSLFNFAVEPESLPVVDAALFGQLEEVLGAGLGEGLPVIEQYARHLEFARRLHAEMDSYGIQVRDMIDTQSLIRIAAEEQKMWATERAHAGGVRTASARRGRAESYLSVCAIYRDEAPYLREWIEFHRLVGVEKFFLYNDRSKDAHLEVLEPYVEDSTVTLHDWAVFPAGQPPAYDHCLTEHGDQSRWIAFIDLDEFLFSPTYQPLPELLAELEPWPGVGVNSVFFGTSGHRTRPTGLVIENYLENDDGEGKLAIKSIVDPARAARCESVHSFAYRDGMAVNEHGYPIRANRTKSVSHSLLRINHYWARSEEQFRAKCAAPMPATGTFRPWYDMRRLSGGRLNDASHAILEYAPALRAALGESAKVGNP